MRPWLGIALALLVAGCTAPPSSEDPVFAPPEPIARQALALAVPEAVPRESVSVAVAAEPVWVKPLRNVTASVVAPAEAKVDWFVSVDGDDVRVREVNGHPYLTRWTTPFHEAPRGPPRTPVAFEVRPGEGARSLLVETPGRMALGLGGGALLNLTVRPSAAAGAPSQAFITGGQGQFRVVPDELDVRPGTRVLVWNAADVPLRVAELSFGALLATDARAVDVTPADDGLFRLEAVATQGRALGVANVRFLADFERPNDNVSLGRMSGTFAPVWTRTEDVTTVRARYFVDHMDLHMELGTSFPEGAVRYSLSQDGKEVASARAPERGDLVLRSLAAGDYVLRVVPESGGVVSYDLTGTMQYTLPVPARLRDAER